MKRLSHLHPLINPLLQMEGHRVIPSKRDSMGQTAQISGYQSVKFISTLFDYLSARKWGRAPPRTDLSGNAEGAHELWWPLLPAQRHAGASI